MSARRTLAGGLLCAIALGGCGVGAGSTPNAPIALTVTRDFGTTSLVELPKAKVAGSDTVMRLLQRNVTGVKTRYGNQFVQAIDGVAGGRRDGRPVDWFVY